MPAVELSDAEWQQIINILGDVPWKVAHPLLMRIGGQLNAQAQQPPPVRPPTAEELKRMGGVKLDANGKEVGHE